MCEFNQTQVTQIKLLGFRGVYKFRIVLFMVFLLTYVMILIGNVLIIMLVTTVDQLKIPMFFLLKHLATSDVLLTTTVIPMTLEVIIKDEGRLSLFGCITQLYFVGFIGYSQCFLIAVMSYDRYLAICNPLRYSSLMNAHVFSQLIIGMWILAIIVVSSEIAVAFQFNYCGLNSIDHFYCDFIPVIKLSTSDISALILQDFVISIFTIFLPFVFIIITYIFIVVTILKISSTSGRRKAFSTCSSHLTIVCSYYGLLFIVYIVPSEESSTNTVDTKYKSLLYIVVSPLMNPIIYSLRNHEIKRALQKILVNFKSRI
ncbi:olfactory receptor 10A7-like [Mantella aurantiaca]